MKKQFILSVGREYGSGGRVIAEAIAKHYGVPFYEKNMLSSLAEEKHVDPKLYQEFDEKKRISFFSRTVRGMSSSHYDNLAQLQFDFLKKKADAGESYVVLGRCSEYVLREYDCLISCFLLADKDAKIERIMKLYDKSRVAAEDFCHLMDSNRKHFHNSYSHVKWGDSRAYDISINTTRLGIDGTKDFLIQYIDKRLEL